MKNGNDRTQFKVLIKLNHTCVFKNEINGLNQTSIEKVLNFTLHFIENKIQD